MAEDPKDAGGAPTETPAELTAMLDLLDRDPALETELPTPTKTPDPVASDDEAPDDADDVAADDEDEAPAPAPTTKRKLKVGEDEVDEDEVLEWKRSGLRQQDYTRKTQAVAERQKTLDAEQARVLADKEQYATLVKQAEEIVKGSAAEPDWETLRKTVTPAQFDEQWRNWQVYERRLSKIADERQRAEAEATKEREKVTARRREVFQERLLEVIPEWQDEAAAKKDGAKILAHAEKLGFTRQELQGIDRPELLLLLRDAADMAALREQLKSRRQHPAGKKAAAVGAQRAGAATPEGVARTPAARAAARLKKSGLVEDAAILFEGLL